MSKQQQIPSVENAGIIAVEISERHNEMTAQEQAYFVAGFQECVKYLNMQYPKKRSRRLPEE